jgi:Mg-chelatase subunit ChlD
VTLLHPVWLLLAIPLAAALWRWRLPSRLLLAMRVGLLGLLLLALCGPVVRLPSRAGTLVVVADRSLSMPPDSASVQKETIDLLHAAMGPDDRLAVVSFGRSAAIEQPPRAQKFAGFANELGRDASNLAEAVETALALIPPGDPGKVLILSDGRWTGRDPAGVAARAAARGVALDYRSLQRSSANDLAVARVDAPGSVTPGESFLITAWVQSPVRQPASFELFRGDRRLAAGTQRLAPGLNRLTFRDRAADPGTLAYTLTVAGRGKDPVPENNTAHFLVGVRGPRPILLVTASPRSGLARLLAAGGLKVKTARPEGCTWSLEELSRYAAVLLENVPAEAVGTAGMETLAAWVRETGAGLMLTGGRNSYGPGGYYQSPLEPVLPVSMELRSQHRKLALAIVVALDRSGSMAAPVGGGKVKMDLANLGTAQVLNLLSPIDELGVLAVDTAPHVIQPMAHIRDKAPVRGKILRIESMGGGIYVYVALDAAYKMLGSATAGTRHIILFADAADAEEPGRYQELLRRCRRDNITVSVIGLGTTTDKDAALLRDIARRGNGRCFFTAKPDELPRLFAQDTFVVARSTFLDEPTPIRPTPGLTALTGKDLGKAPPIGGYNLCYLRQGANLAAMTVDEYKAPVVAAWQTGSGRVLCYTGEADGKYTGAIARWKNAGHFFTSLARWTAGPADNLPDNMLLTQDVKDGTLVVQLHLDPERKADLFRTPPRVTVLRSAGGGPHSEKIDLRWAGADLLTAHVPLSGSQTAIATVEVPGHGPVSLPPVCLPYSPEYRPAEAGRGLQALERLARATGGKERVELAGVWKDLPKQARPVELGPWLLLAAVVLLLVEVLERRTGLLGRGGWFERERDEARRPRRKWGWAWRRRAAPKPQEPPAPAVEEPVPEPEPAAPAEAAEAGGLIEALRRARQRAKGLTDRPE